MVLRFKSGKKTTIFTFVKEIPMTDKSMKASVNAVINSAGDLPSINEGQTDLEIRQHRKKMLVAAFRIFGKFGFDEGLAGHITVRDPELHDHFWVNPLGVSFRQMNMSDLLLVNDHGDIVEGTGYLNGAAFTIHSHIHRARPDVIAAAHAHSIYGKAWSSLGRKLDPITQDACAFHHDHVLYSDFNGVVLNENEGIAIANALDNNKAAILQNHGLLTVGETVESAVWWFITMERSCQAQLLAEAAGKPLIINDSVASATHKVIGSETTGYFSFLPMFNVLMEEQPDLFS
ncbi:MAG: ribulose-5-phosphate 4-epimerase/fuculose-1-phosphate aldolase [Colwellia sp.]